jgi:uncharacterized protein (DUF302 family)
MGFATAGTREVGMGLADNGVMNVRSLHSFAGTVARLEAALEAKSLRVFARVDHSGEAEAVGLKMRPTQLVIFGSPRAGTALMVASPELAIDLPLKALVWEDGDGQVWLSYNSLEYLARRHGIPDELMKGISGASVVVESAAK